MPFETSDDLAAYLEGCVSCEQLPNAVRPMRLGKTALGRVPTAFMKMTVGCGAGVRLRFRTTASHITLTGTFWFIDIGTAQNWPTPMIDLVVGDVITSHPVDDGARAMLDPSTGTVRFTTPATTTVTLAIPGQGDQIVEVWLPQSAICDLHSLTADAPVKLTGDVRPRWIHYGSSISHGLEIISPARTWPAMVARKNDLDLQNLAFAGNAMLDPFLARQIRDMPADLISLKVGINVVNADAMKLRTFIPAVEGFLDTIRDGHPETPIILLSSIVCPSVERRPGPTAQDAAGQYYSVGRDEPRPDELTLERTRHVLRSIVTERELDQHLYYIDGLTLLDQSEVARGFLTDGLHPNTAGGEVIARNVDEAFARLGVLAKTVPTAAGRRG